MLGDALPFNYVSQMSATLPVRYEALIAAGEIERDAAQLDVIDKLARLQSQLVDQGLATKSSALGWLFGRREAAELVKGSTSTARSVAARPC